MPPKVARLTCENHASVEVGVIKRIFEVTGKYIRVSWIKFIVQIERTAC